MKYAKMDWGTMEAVVNKLGGMEGVERFLNGTVEVIMKVISYITHTFTVLVDETQTVEEAVKAGNFSWSNENIISKKFPKPANGQKADKEIVLFHFNKIMSSDDAVAEMDKAGFRPMTPWDTLGLATKEPDLQRKFPIVALGSVCVLGGYRLVAYLYEYAGSRKLDLYYYDDSWDGRCRFGAVRK